MGGGAGCGRGRGRGQESHLHPVRPSVTPGSGRVLSEKPAGTTASASSCPGLTTPGELRATEHPPPPPEAGKKGQGQRATPTPSGANSAARLHVYVCHMCTRVCTHARRHTPASSMGPSILPGLRPPLLRLSPSRFLEKKPPLSLRPPEHRSPVGPLSLSCSTLGHVVGSGRDMPPTSCNERWPGLRLEL